MQKIVSGVTIGQVKAALLEQYGHQNVKEVEIGASRGVWNYQITPKNPCRCEASISDSGCVIVMKARLSQPMKIFLLIGFLACVVPGLFLGCFLLIGQMITNTLVANRFPAMLASLERQKVSTP